MHRTVVVDVVGLTPELLGPHTPNLSLLAARGAMRPLETVTPAVTCSVQSTFTTGLPPSGHGCVANGWYFRDLCEVLLWRQSNHLVAGQKIWEAARERDPSFTCFKHFWWYNMYSSADFSVTPRPMYPADGRKIPDVYTQPAALRDELNEKFGSFPLFRFWGPTADIVSSRWIVDSALHVFETRKPTLSLVYLPHLDYCLQKLGPSHPDIARQLTAIDVECGRIIERAAAERARIMVVSEYGITPVSDAVHLNRALRRAGFLAVREEMGRELLDAGASRAFAVCDHQVAHVYVRNADEIGRVRDVVESVEGVETVLDAEGKKRAGLAHSRSGELVAVSRADRWFSYYYWLDDTRAPDFARTVDIHRKPGYDPVELFIDPSLTLPQLRIGWRLLEKTVGMRTLMDVIPLDASLVRGSHGRPTDSPEQGPLCITSEPALLAGDSIAAVQIKDLVLRHLFEG